MVNPVANSIGKQTKFKYSYCFEYSRVNETLNHNATLVHHCSINLACALAPHVHDTNCAGALHGRAVMYNPCIPYTYAELTRSRWKSAFFVVLKRVKIHNRGSSWLL